jgi:hypothetical protein
MKTRNIIVGLFALLCLLVGGGCAGLKLENTVRGIAQGAIYYGTVKHLRAHPADRPAFEATKAQLEAMVVQTNWNAETLAAAFNALPIDALSGPDGDLYKSTFLVVWSSAADESVSVQTPEEVRSIVSPLLSGLRLGLAAVPDTTKRVEYGTGRDSPAAEYLRYGAFDHRANWSTRYIY